MLKQSLFTRVTTQAGQSIIEVLVAIAVVGVVLTTIASGLTYSVKNTAEARYRSVATALAQDAVEVFRRERSILGWESFYEVFVGAPDQVYCFNTLPANSAAFVALSEGACSAGFQQVGTEFRRQVTVDPTGSILTVTVVVSWYDGDNQRSVQVQQDFQQWQ